MFINKFKLMKRRTKIRQTLAFICFVFISLQPATAQEVNVKLGKIDKEDFEITSFRGDTSFSAIVLYDHGRSFFTFDKYHGFRLNFTHHCIIKILNSSGYKYADITIPLYHNPRSEEGVTNLKGYTYNLENGKIDKVKFRSRDKYTEDVSENWKHVKFSMPDVKSGSIIEYEYNVISDFAWSLKEWYFQTDIPILWSEYEVEIPEFYKYKKNAQGYQKFEISESSSQPGTATFQTKQRTGHRTSPTRTEYDYHRINYRVNTNRWVMKDVPAFKAEPFMPPRKDYISKIKFEIASSDFTRFQGEYVNYTRSWKAITEEILKRSDFGGQLKREGLVKDEVETVTDGITPQKDKMIALYNYVKDNIKWNKDYGIYTSDNLRKVLKEKSGGTAEINILLTVMMKEAEIEAYPVILSTRTHGRINFEQPTLNQMNYVICCAMIDGENYLLDATDQHRPYYHLPKRCLNGKGKIICETKLNEWIELQSNEESNEGTMTIMKITEENKLNGSVKKTYQNMLAFRRRTEILSKGKEKYIEDFKKEHSNWEIENHTIENLEDVAQNLSQSYTVTISDYIEEAGDMLFFNPVFTGRQEENPFNNDSRKYPVDFIYPVKESYTMSLVIPENYMIEEVPEPIKLSLPENTANFQYLVNARGKTIQVVYRLNIQKTFYLPDEYKAIQNFFSAIVSKQSEKIVLKKM